MAHMRQPTRANFVKKALYNLEHSEYNTVNSAPLIMGCESVEMSPGLAMTLMMCAMMMCSTCWRGCYARARSFFVWGCVERVVQFDVCRGIKEEREDDRKNPGLHCVALRKR